MCIRDSSYAQLGGVPSGDAYARLIDDCIQGDPNLFTRSDAVEASWKFFDPVLRYWKEMCIRDRLCPVIFATPEKCKPEAILPVTFMKQLIIKPELLSPPMLSLIHI